MQVGFLIAAIALSGVAYHRIIGATAVQVIRTRIAPCSAVLSKDGIALITIMGGDAVAGFSDTAAVSIIGVTLGSAASGGADLLVAAVIGEAENVAAAAIGGGLPAVNLSHACALALLGEVAVGVINQATDQAVAVGSISNFFELVAGVVDVALVDARCSALGAVAEVVVGEAFGADGLGGQAGPFGAVLFLAKGVVAVAVLAEVFDAAGSQVVTTVFELGEGVVDIPLVFAAGAVAEPLLGAAAALIVAVGYKCSIAVPDAG